MPQYPLPITAAVLAWYDRHRRDLPWRAPPGATSDPYAVWLSEIMLQQTTVAAVKAYYTKFLKAWPTVAALASAPLDDVLKAWAGLGYYSRARNLHRCAQVVMAEHGGCFPADEAALLRLPGIGGYTAAAIAAIAFGQRAVVVDGNVERVMTRLHAIGTPLPRGKPLVWAAMDALTPRGRAGDFAQAIMDLGSTICTPRSPACAICPVVDVCAAWHSGAQTDFPKKDAKKAVPTRSGAVFFIRREDGRVLVRQRPATGLFGGMTEFPGTDWTAEFDPSQFNGSHLGVEGPVAPLGAVLHGLTHFTLTLHVYAGRPSKNALETGRWVEPSRLSDEALPTLMRKVLKAALAGGA